MNIFAAHLCCAGTHLARVRGTHAHPRCAHHARDGLVFERRSTHFAARWAFDGIEQWRAFDNEIGGGQQSGLRRWPFCAVSASRHGGVISWRVNINGDVYGG